MGDFWQLFNSITLVSAAAAAAGAAAVSAATATAVAARRAAQHASAVQQQQQQQQQQQLDLSGLMLCDPWPRIIWGVFTAHQQLLHFCEEP
ncbi:hypothetical protein Emag_003412 [Eimeria magna]